MAQSGLALLAFQAGGHFYFNDRKYSPVVRRGLDWLVKHQQADGGLFPSRDRNRMFERNYMYEHGMAAFALSEPARWPGRPARSPRRTISTPPRKR